MQWSENKDSHLSLVLSQAPKFCRESIAAEKQ